MKKEAVKNTKSQKNELREVAIIGLRFKGFSLQEIGDRYGISRERVRQIIERNEINIDFPKSSLRHKDLPDKIWKPKTLGLRRHLDELGVQCSHEGCVRKTWTGNKCHRHNGYSIVGKGKKFKTEIPKQKPRRFPSLEEFKAKLRRSPTSPVKG